jgi:hypothetical protein
VGVREDTGGKAMSSRTDAVRFRGFSISDPAVGKFPIRGAGNGRGFFGNISVLPTGNFRQFHIADSRAFVRQREAITAGSLSTGPLVSR